MNPKRRKKAALGGLIIAAAGVLCVIWLLAGKENVPWILMVVAPLLLIWGCVALVRGLLKGDEPWSRGSILTTGIVMLLIGGFPWAYTGALVGGSPGNEGAGMMGTLIFLCVGLPGVVVFVIGLGLRFGGRR